MYSRTSESPLRRELGTVGIGLMVGKTHNKTSLYCLLLRTHQGKTNKRKSEESSGPDEYFHSTAGKRGKNKKRNILIYLNIICRIKRKTLSQFYINIYMNPNEILVLQFIFTLNLFSITCIFHISINISKMKKTD
jgi:hypothetical protein